MAAKSPQERAEITPTRSQPPPREDPRQHIDHSYHALGVIVYNAPRH